MILNFKQADDFRLKNFIFNYVIYSSFLILIKFIVISFLLELLFNIKILFVQHSYNRYLNIYFKIVDQQAVLIQLKFHIEKKKIKFLMSLFLPTN